MKTMTMLSLLLSTAVMACSGATLPSTPDAATTDGADASISCEDAGTPDAPVADASPVQTDAGTTDAAPEPCALRIDSITPSTVRGGENVVIRGCGFEGEGGVRDVEVNVWSMPFTVVDDGTIIVRTWDPDVEGAGLELEYPYTAQVDVIRRQPDQVQGSLTYIAK